jgi:hypothetical protein
MASRATAATSNDDPTWKSALIQDFGAANLIVSTKFMESYELVRPVSGGADLTTFLNREGNLDIYSVGTTSQVTRIRQQTNSEQGWGEEPLGINARQLSLYVPAGGDSNNPSLLGLDAGGRLTLSRYDAGAGRYTQQVNQPPKAAQTIKQFLGTKNFDNVYANVILQDDLVATNFLKPDGSWAGQDWVPVKKEKGSGENAKAKRIAMCANNPVQTALYAIGFDDYVHFAERNSQFSYFVNLGFLKVIDIAVVQDSENLLNIFAIDTSKHLWVKRQKKHSSSSSIEWEDWKQIDGTTALVGLHAVIDARGRLEVFAIGEDDLLYHTRQIGTGTTVTWAAVFPLGNPVPNSIFTVGRSGSGYSEAYSVTHDNRLYRFWQDPNTTQWYSAEILLQQDAEMAPIPAHSVELLVIDFQGLAQPEAEVRIKASNLVALNLNGNYFIVSEFRTVTLRANAAGMVTVNIPTQSLSSPTLFVSTNFTADGKAVEVQPNAALQKQLYSVGESQVWEAKDLAGNYLLAGENRTPENAQSLASIANSAMSLGGPPPPSAALRTRVTGPHRLELLRGGLADRPGPGYRIDPSRVAEQHWAVDFRGGFPRHSTLTREEAASHLQRFESLADAQGGFLGVDWGDLWNSIKTGVSKILGSIQQFIVTTIIDPVTKLVQKIRVVFEFLVDGITQVVDKVVEFFQQAFDIVEGIWNKIKVFFQQLWEWLAFLFQWSDIRRTADATEHTLTQSLEFLILGVQAVKATVAAGFDSLTGRIQTSVDEYLKTISGQTDLKQLNDQNDTPQPALDSSSGHNVLQSAFEANYQKGSTVSSPALSRIDSSLDQLVAELSALADNFQFGDGKQAFDEAMGYFNQIGSQPNNALTLVYSGTIKVMEGIALFGIAAAKGVILSVLDLVIVIIGAVRDLLTEEWEIPIVSQLYQLITGESLTFRPMQLFALIVAIPATLLYKIVKGEAPFPDDAALGRFTGTFTAQWLAEQSGIQPKRKSLSAQESALAEEWRKWVAGIFACLTAVVWLLRIWFESAAIILTQIIKMPTRLAICLIGAGFLNVFFTTPWIVKADAGGFSCTEGAGLGNLTWLLNAVLGPGLGAVFMLTGVKAPVPDIIQTIWGAGHLALVVIVAVLGGPSATQTAANVFTCLSPQLFRFLKPYEIWGELVIFTAAGLIVTLVLTYPTIGALQLAATFGDELDDANSRMAGPEVALLPAALAA